MNISNNTILKYQKNGVIVLRNIISEYWIKELKKGVIKNFDNPSKYMCIYEKKRDKKLFYDDYCNWQRISEYKNFLYQLF